MSLVSDFTVSLIQHTYKTTKQTNSPVKTEWKQSNRAIIIGKVMIPVTRD